jgi:hypothetical protein
VSAAVTPKVSFSTTTGNLVIAIKGYQGQKFTAKIGSSWISKPVLVNSPGLDYTKIVRKSVSKTTVKYEAYIDGKKVASGSIRIR